MSVIAFPVNRYSESQNFVAMDKLLHAVGHLRNAYRPGMTNREARNNFDARQILLDLAGQLCAPMKEES